MLKLAVYPAAEDATQMYRSLFPHRTMAERSLASFKTYLSPTFDSDAQVAIFQRAITQEHFELMKEYKSKGIKTVFDIDDDVPNLDKTNPANMVFGSNREFIRKQHTALLSTPGIDKVLPYYKPLLSMKTEEAIEFAVGNFERLMKMMKFADLVTVSTVHLKKSYGGWGIKNIRVLENQEKASEWNSVMKTPLLGRTVVGWAGGIAHYFTDLKPIREAAMRVLKENPEVHLHILGIPEAGALFEMKDRVFVEPWTTWDNYKTNIAEFDITLAPSFGNRKFNQGKSDIRCLQSWMCGNPVVASEVTYGDSVIKSGGGILADNPLEWYEALTLLVHDTGARRDIGNYGKRYVQDYRTYEGRIGEWEAAYASLLTF